MKSIQPVSSPARARNVIVLLMLALSVLSYIDRTVISIAGPTLIKEFGFSETQMGSIYSVFILSYALFMFPGGWLADRFGPRLILALTSLGSALFPALTAFAGLPMLSATLGVLPSFLWVRLGFGLCTAPLYPACGRLTANWFPIASRARLQGVVLSGAALGGAITPILFSRLIAGFGWRVSLGGWLSDRLIPRWGPHLSRRRVAVAGMALSALLLYLGINITNTLAMVALLSLALGLAASAEGPFWASAIDAGGRQAGAAGGLLNSVGNFGGLLAPTLTPYLAQRFGWTCGLHFGSLMVLLGAASWFLVQPVQDLNRARPAEAERRL